MTLLSSEELAIIDMLSSVWHEYVKLEILHPNDMREFLQAIHAAQNIVMARPAVREMYVEDKPMEKITG